MQKVQSLLEHALHRHGIKDIVEATQIMKAFRTVCSTELGKNLSTMCEARYVKNKQLYIACASSVVSHSIMLQKRRIIYVLNKQFGKGTILDIKIML